MTAKLVYSVVLLVLVCLAESTKVNWLPRVCKEEDSKCITEVGKQVLTTFSRGHPEYNVETLEPIHIIRSDCSTAGLKLILTDIDLHGFKNTKIDYLRFDTTNQKFYFKAVLELNGKFKYDMDGNLLILPVKGKGNGKINLRGFEIIGTVNYKTEKGKDGERHWKITGSSYEFHLKSKSDLTLENLFAQNAIAASAAEKVIADNSNAIVTELAPPLIKAIVEKIVANIGNFVTAVPIKDLTL